MVRMPTTIADFRNAARRRLPAAIFGTLEGGAGEELAVLRNLSDLRGVRLTPRVLVDVQDIDPSIEILGRYSPLPLILAPTGLSGLYRPRGEVLVAKGAQDLVYVQSCFSSVSMEEVTAASAGRKWFQLYPFRSRELMRDLMSRARTHGYEALCVTVDVPALGIRYRDARSGIRADAPSIGLLVDAAMHPRWSLPYLAGYRPRLPLLQPNFDRARGGWLPLATPDLSASFVWKDLEWVIEEWGGPVVVKGVLHPEDAKRAFSAGARAIVVSNHGGRQLEAAASPISVLPAIRQAVGPAAEIYADGGITCGEDILKFVIAGANACLIGRAYLYGLIVDGSSGVAEVIEILKRELEIALRLTGTTGLRRNDKVHSCEE
jgi:isopentenyl diphosphate isomerase/L-lactate dehydrogenase-like FMN-dependent dehydrogenase